MAKQTPIKIEVIARIREVIVFTTKEKLVAQIDRDVSMVREIARSA